MKPSTKAKGAVFNKYLKPGALAKLRDTKISKVRFWKKPDNGIEALTRLLESGLLARGRARVFDEVPRFVSSYGGVQCFKRKKLVAVNALVH